MTVAYRTYGALNAARSNAVLVCHALTGDQYVAETHPVTGKEGWWERWSARTALDTDRFFVIGANVLGGCMGATGPRGEREADRRTGRAGLLGAPIFRRSPSATWSAPRSG